MRHIAQQRDEGEDRRQAEAFGEREQRGERSGPNKLPSCGGPQHDGILANELQTGSNPNLSNADKQMPRPTRRIA